MIDRKSADLARGIIAKRDVEGDAGAGIIDGHKVVARAAVSRITGFVGGQCLEHGILQNIGAAIQTGCHLVDVLMPGFAPLLVMLIPTQQRAALKRNHTPRAQVYRPGKRPQSGLGHTFIVDLEQYVTEVPPRSLQRRIDQGAAVQLLAIVE